MRVWPCILIIFCMLTITSAQESDTPYLYYYSNDLNAFIIERADGGDSRVFASDIMPIDTNTVGGAGWSPSGKWFAWMSADQQWMKTAAYSAWLLNVDGKQQIRLQDDLTNVQYMSWSPIDDFLFISEFHGYELDSHFIEYEMRKFYLFDLEKQKFIGISELKPVRESLSSIFWSSDGKYVAFCYSTYTDYENQSRAPTLQRKVFISGDIQDEVVEPEFHNAICKSDREQESVSLDSILFSADERYSIQLNRSLQIFDHQTQETNLVQLHNDEKLPSNYILLNARWHFSQNWLITGEAIDLNWGYRMTGVVKADGTNQRELGACYFTETCANWLPPQVTLMENDEFSLLTDRVS